MKLGASVWVALPLALAALACDKGSGDSASPPASASAPAASNAPATSGAASVSPSASASASAAAFAAKGMSRHHVGVAGVLLRGAYDFNLTDSQRSALDKAEDQLYADTTSSPWTAMKTFQMDLVAGIRATKLDNAKLQTDYAAIDKAVEAGQAREADALNALHATLEPTQRQALADQVKAKRAAHEKGPMTAPDGGAIDWTKNRLARLTAELALDDTQQKAVAALMAKDTTMTPAAMQAKREAGQKRVDALLTEFVKDPFDAKKLDLSQGGGKTPHDSMERHATFTASLLTILHPDQREKLAVRTERTANRPGRYFDDVESGPPQGGPDEDTPAARLR
jgi:hypothetical protein